MPTGFATWAALSELGQNDEAAACFRRAAEINPQLGEAHFNFGGRCCKAKATTRPRSSRTRTRSASSRTACRPLIPGHALQATGQAARGDRLLPARLEFHPDFAEVLNNLGNIFKIQGRIDEARVCYDQTLRIRPDYLQARCNRALMDLADGNFAEGWADYEYRSSYPEFPRRAWDQPAWHGEPLEGAHAAGTRRAGAGRHPNLFVMRPCWRAGMEC